MAENTTKGIGEYSGSFTSKRIIEKTRVEHTCHKCKLLILKGSSAIRYAGIFECQFFNVYLHKYCDDKE